MRSVRKTSRETSIAGADVSGQSLRGVYAGAERDRPDHRLGALVSTVTLVVRLSVGERVETLAAISVALSSLAVGRETCRAGPGETPGFGV